LVHRSTYRQFGREEWEDIEARLDDWRVALEGVLGGEAMAVLKEQEQAQQHVNGPPGLETEHVSA
jgi:translation initiation factor 3 subunit M